jgi:hypothetical protein
MSLSPLTGVFSASVHTCEGIYHVLRGLAGGKNFVITPTGYIVAVNNPKDPIEAIHGDRQGSPLYELMPLPRMRQIVAYRGAAGCESGECGPLRPHHEGLGWKSHLVDPKRAAS